MAISMAVSLWGCSKATVTVAPTPIPTKALTPYQTVTSTAVIPTTTLAVTIPVTPAPTSTPFLHTITNDDTMLGIAFQYGITLEELQAANPGVDSHYLSVGKQLIIPLNGDIEETMPTLTPVPVRWEQPRCQRTGDGGLWCIVTVENNQDYSVENLSAWIGLYTEQGAIIYQQTVYGPINLLKPGGKIPLMAYFAPPIPAQEEARAELLTAISVAKGDNRYLELQAEIETPIISPDGRQVEVTGKVVLADDSMKPSTLWVLAVAFDSDGNIIGARRWESDGELTFTITVFAISETIDHIEILTEAR